MSPQVLRNKNFNIKLQDAQLSHADTPGTVFSSLQILCKHERPQEEDRG